MAVEAVASGVIQKVTDLLIQESVIFDRVIDQVEDIRLELRQMRGFFMGAEELQHTANSVQKWVEDYLATLYEVEDIVESYVLKLARKKRGMSFFQNYGFFFHDTAAWQNLRTKMKRIEKRIKKLKTKKPGEVEDASLRGNSPRWKENQLALGDASPQCLTEQKCSSSSSNEKESSDLEAEERKLDDEIDAECGHRIGVYGPLGSGKTTLVRGIYDRKRIKKHFKCYVWLNVSEEHILEDLLRKVWHEVDIKRDGDIKFLDVQQLKDELKEFLKTQKYLIVLDDARKQPDKWKEVKELIEAFPMGNGSKVVLVTREEDIAKTHGGENLTFCLSGLDNFHSMELLKRILRDETGNAFHQNATLWNKILPKCKGLSGDIELLGGILSTKKSGDEELTRLFNQFDHDQPEIWLISYNDLPANYKLCLLYLALFPKEFEVSVRRILRLWLAEGFLKRSPDPPGLSEDLAEECFNFLVKRKLVKISKFRSDGGPKKCRLPGFLRDNLSPKAQEIRLFHIHQKSAGKSPPEARRIVEYTDIKSYVSPSVENLRSYLSFKFSRYDTPTTEVRDFLQKLIGKEGFGLLRILDLEGVYKPELPASLKHLFQLRYLGLRSTFLDTLPESVGHLPYLETLDLKRTCISRLPSSVWKLEHLRHLNLPQIRLDMRKHKLRSRLLTLWGLTIDDKSIGENGLDRLVDLRELGITCQLKDFGELQRWIARLTSLHSLSLISKDETGRPSNLTLEPLSELHELSHIKLLGQITLTQDHFPPNLKVLTLSLSQLAEDPMPILSKLPSLIVLRLLAKSYIGEKMHCQQNGFRSLRVLKLWMLPEVEELTVESGAMPNIRELNVRCCHKLKKLPCELLKQTTSEPLEELVMTTHKDPLCMQELEQHVTKTKSSRTNLTINRYDFSPLPWEKEPDLWEFNKEAAKE